MKRGKAKSFRNSIRDALFFYALATVAAMIAALVILFGAALYFFLLHQGEKEHQKVCSAIEETIRSTRTSLEELGNNTALADKLENQSPGAELNEKLYSIVNTGKMRGSFYLIDKEFQCFSGSMKIQPDYFKEQFSNSQFIRRALENQKGVCSGWEQSGKDGLPSYVMAAGIFNEKEAAGYVLVEYGQDRFMDLTKELWSDVIVTNPVGRVYWNTGTQLMDDRERILDEVRYRSGLSFVDGHFFYSCFTRLDNGSLTVYTVKDITEPVRIFGVVSMAVVLVFVCMLILDSYVSAVVARKKTQVIDQISTTMQQGTRDGLYVPMIIDSEDEVGQIADAYNNLGKEINQLMENNREITRLQMLAEVRRLESQFNPHFIFNTLETIRVLVSIEPLGAQKAITRLAELLRYSIDDSFDRVSLEKDIYYTECYLYIQKLRLQKKLEYRIDCEEEISGALVQRLIIQPLVENAIQYGKDENGFCNIEINIGRKNNSLWIQVTDHGQPVPDEKLSQLQKMLDQEQNTSNHLGLYQLHRRIRLAYGMDYGLTFWKREKGGMCFRLELPYETEK